MSENQGSLHDQIIAKLGEGTPVENNPGVYNHTLTFSSEKVKNEYLATLNVPEEQQAHFPLSFEVQTADDVVVSPNNPLIIKSSDGSPVVRSYNQITIETGGQIQCLADTVLTVNKIIKK